jgi:tetratricopeptide (TPR) repeat protein
MRRLIFISLLALAACTPKSIPAPTVSTPRFPEFITPVLPPELSGGPMAMSQDRGWRFLQAGDLRNAEHEFLVALKASPAFFPAEAGLGYVQLARMDAKAALAHFERVLGQQSRDLSALVGRAQALLTLERETDALAAFEAVLAVDPSLTDVARRVDVLRFRSQQEALNQARGAAQAGRFQEAASLYAKAIASSPDSPFLYRELAGVERQLGDDDRALEHFRRAIALEPDDVKPLVQIGEILEARADFEGAAKAYGEALASGPNPDVEARLDGVRTRIELARLPEQYRAIDSAAQITRGDLAALIGVRLGLLLRPASGQETVLVTDIRNSWAATWILLVARAGVMEPFANHAFQPETVVRRVDLAQVVSRLLTKLAEQTPTQPHAWQSARLAFSDLADGHLAYPAASAAVASGVMAIEPNDSFQPSRVVTGQEASDTIGRLEVMSRNALSTEKNAR